MRSSIVIGTRKSPLALWQSEFIKTRLQQCFPAVQVGVRHIVTRGDTTQEAQIPLPEIGGKGLFTAELEESLNAGEIDLAVHSLKDLPTILPVAFVLGAIPEREACEDVLVSRSGKPLRDLPSGSVVGTSSLRRSSQVLRIRPDLQIQHIRGNVGTRISKAQDVDGPYDATIVARAGVVRLGLESEVTEILATSDILPAPGQGALGIECRSDDAELLEMLAVLNHKETEHAVTTERAFLAALEAGCNTPVGALCRVVQREGRSVLFFSGRCVSADGTKTIEVSGTDEVSRAHELGIAMAEEVRSQGFDDL